MTLLLWGDNPGSCCSGVGLGPLATAGMGAACSPTDAAVLGGGDLPVALQMPVWGGGCAAQGTAGPGRVGNPRRRRSGLGDSLRHRCHHHCWSGLWGVACSPTAVGLGVATAGLGGRRPRAPPPLQGRTGDQLPGAARGAASVLVLSFPSRWGGPGISRTSAVKFTEVTESHESHDFCDVRE